MALKIAATWFTNVGESVLVSGGAGFLGAHLVQRLLAEGWEVHATSRSERKSSSTNLTFHQADLSDLDVARRILQHVKPEVVFHLAGSVGAPVEKSLVLDTYHSHVTSTLHLLTLADDYQLRRVVVTGSLLEPTGDVAEAVPSSPYAAAKLASTLYARMFNHLYATPVVVIRPFMTFGPGQHPGKVLPCVISSLLDGVSPELSSGDWRADWIYVSDVIDGLMLAMKTPGLAGADIDLGHGELTSVKNVVTAVHRLMQSDVPLRFGGIEDRPSPPEIIANTSVAARLLNWVPSVDVQEGLARTIEWHRVSRTIPQ